MLKIPSISLPKNFSSIFKPEKVPRGTGLRTLDDWSEQGKPTEFRRHAAHAIAKTIAGVQKGKPETKLPLGTMGLEELPQDIEKSKATTIDLSNNQLTDVPMHVTSLMDLTELDLSRNKLETLIEHFARLVFLQKLDLSSNLLLEVPAAIGSLVNLKSLKLDRNMIRGLPESISGLRLLEELSAAKNDLVSVDPAIGNLLYLQRLKLAHNPELKALPDEYGPLLSTRLVDANFKDTDLEELPPIPKHPTALKKLNLKNNPRMRTLPTSFGPLLQDSSSFDLLKTTYKPNTLTIDVTGTYVKESMAAAGRLRMSKAYRKISPAAHAPLPPVDDPNLIPLETDSIGNMEPPTNELPVELVMDQPEILLRVEDFKLTGGGPADLVDFKQAVYRQNLLTIFAFTYWQIQNTQGRFLHLRELEIAFNLATTDELNLPFREELQGVGAVAPLSFDEIQEAVQAVRHLEKVSDPHTNFAARQIPELAHSGISLALTPRQIAKEFVEIRRRYGDPTTQSLSISKSMELARGIFRQFVLNCMGHIVSHFTPTPTDLEVSPPDGPKLALIYQALLAERLNLPGKIREYTLPEALASWATDVDIDLVEETVLMLEDTGQGAMLKNFLETKPFWQDYLHDLAESLLILDKEVVEAEAYVIGYEGGWTSEYRELARGLFRQAKLNLVSSREAYDRNEAEQEIVDGNIIALNYQLQLAEELRLPRPLREFPKDVAQIICWRIPTERLERVAYAVLQFETMNEGRYLEEFLETQPFWRKHLDARQAMIENEEAFIKGLRFLRNLAGKLGIIPRFENPSGLDYCLAPRRCFGPLPPPAPPEQEPKFADPPPPRAGLLAAEWDGPMQFGPLKQKGLAPGRAENVGLGGTSSDRYAPPEYGKNVGLGGTSSDQYAPPEYGKKSVSIDRGETSRAGTHDRKR